MKVAIILNRVDFGGVSVANTLIYEQLVRFKHDVQLIAVSPEESNGTFLLDEKNIQVKRPCLGIDSLRKRCSILVEELRGIDAVIFAESPEAQYVVSALPDTTVVVKEVQNTVECMERRLLWNEEAISAFVCISPVVREMALLRKISAPIHLIPNCTDFEIPTSPRQYKEKPLISYVGRFHELHKGISVLPKIASILKGQGINAKWILAGDGAISEREALEAGFEKTGVDYTIERMDQAGVRELLSKADFLIVPSNFEAFGIVLVEAMAMGSIPVCSNAPAFSWILGNFSEDLQIMDNTPEEYAAIVERLLMNFDVRVELEAGLKKRQKAYFSAEVIGLRYHNLIMNLRQSDRVLNRSGAIRIPTRKRVKDCWWGRLLHYFYMRCK